MKLNQAQEDALESIKNLEPGQILIIQGAAGTGKTQILKHLELTNYVILAPTGKAASRVREVTGGEAHTIHSFLYNVFQDPISGYLEFRKPTPEEGEERFGAIKYVVIDEASMVSPDLWKDLCEIGAEFNWRYVLVGDGFQLPPVIGAESQGRRNWSIFDGQFQFTKKVVLSEVHRQALDSPVIAAATAIRLGENPAVSLYRFFESVDYKAIPSLYNEDTALICHTNKTREEINKKTRELQGFFGEMPLKGEPLVVNRNSYGVNVFNGEVFSVTSSEVINKVPMVVRDNSSSATDRATYYKLGISKGDTEIATSSLSLSGKSAVKPFYIEKEFYRMKKKHFGIELLFYVEMQFGYAFTCHKMQGQEIPGVVVVIEPTADIMSLQGRKWLYTALTRAKKSCKFSFL